MISVQDHKWVWSLPLSFVIVLIVVGLAGPAAATNGYFAHGYGTINKALAGAGSAFPQDTLSAATNPAGLAFVGKRYDGGLAIFNPSRHYTVTGEPSRYH